jgi:hypothetical protein
VRRPAANLLVDTQKPLSLVSARRAAVAAARAVAVQVAFEGANFETSFSLFHLIGSRVRTRRLSSYG